MKKVAWNKGRKMTQITKDRISASRKGKSAWNRGKRWPEETKAKISESKQGRESWNKGIPWSKKVKKKISKTKLLPEKKFSSYYGKLDIKFKGNFSKVDSWLKEQNRKIITVDCPRGNETLPTHIRHCIHHADHPLRYTQIELNKAIKILSSLKL